MPIPIQLYKAPGFPLFSFSFPSLLPPSSSFYPPHPPLITYITGRAKEDSPCIWTRQGGFPMRGG